MFSDWTYDSVEWVILITGCVPAVTGSHPDTQWLAHNYDVAAFCGHIIIICNLHCHLQGRGIHLTMATEGVGTGIAKWQLHDITILIMLLNKGNLGPKTMLSEDYLYYETK